MCNNESFSHWKYVLKNLIRANNNSKSAYYINEMPVGLSMKYNNNYIDLHNIGHIHCEMQIDILKIKNAEIFLSHEPCPMCFFYLCLHKASTIYFLFNNNNYGACGGSFILNNYIDKIKKVNFFGPFSGMLNETNYLKKYFYSHR